MIATFFMFMMFIFGIVLFVASTIIDGDLTDKCPNPDARKLNMYVSMLGTMLATAALCYLVCHLKCGCSMSTDSILIYSGMAMMIFIGALTLSVMTNNQLSGDCPAAKQWLLILISISSTGFAICLAMIVYSWKNYDKLEKQNALDYSEVKKEDKKANVVEMQIIQPVEVNKSIEPSKSSEPVKAEIKPQIKTEKVQTPVLRTPPPPPRPVSQKPKVTAESRSSSGKNNDYVRGKSADLRGTEPHPLDDVSTFEEASRGMKPAPRSRSPSPSQSLVSTPRSTAGTTTQFNMERSASDDSFTSPE